ncbi:hypothetical protein [Limisphaera sp. VF-2]|jgi:hypothetical protein|uniref:hypothetical protein n=1 Tax=Limisphaera sp. VF-2 TaxID=3400418 RepID=UPI0017557AEF
MHSKPEEFARLRRLLALKRYERPPAGCLEAMRQATLLELRRLHHAGLNTQSAAEGPTWWRFLWEALAPRPLLAGALGVVVCALVVGAVLQAERLELPTGMESTRAPWNQVSVSPGMLGLPNAPGVPSFPEVHPLLATTNPPGQSGLLDGVQGPPLLFQPPPLDVQRASGVPSAHSNLMVP